MKNQLAELRKSKSITQEKLAELVGVSRNYISMIENSSKPGSIRVLHNIAKVLDVKIDDIFLD